MAFSKLVHCEVGSQFDEADHFAVAAKWQFTTREEAFEFQAALVKFSGPETTAGPGKLQVLSHTPDPAGLVPAGQDVDAPMADKPARRAKATKAVETTSGPQEPKNEEPQRPREASAIPTVDAALANSKNLREVLTWMLDHGYGKPAEVLAVCENLRVHVPVLARIAPELLLSRIEKGLEVLQMERKAANGTATA